MEMEPVGAMERRAAFLTPFSTSPDQVFGQGLDEGTLEVLPGVKGGEGAPGSGQAGAFSVSGFLDAPHGLLGEADGTLGAVGEAQHGQGVGQAHDPEADPSAPQGGFPLSP
jgi:hypothetical protein